MLHLPKKITGLESGFVILILPQSYDSREKLMPGLCVGSKLISPNVPLHLSHNQMCNQGITICNESVTRTTELMVELLLLKQTDKQNILIRGNMMYL